MLISKEVYYVVLELPFDTLLVHYYGFANLSDAEDLQADKLPWFSIWDQSQLDGWVGEKILIPLKTAKNVDNRYTFNVTYDTILSAESSNTAHKQLRRAIAKAGLAVNNLKTKITRKEVNLRSQ
jgi:hypothetical protein